MEEVEVGGTIGDLGEVLGMREQTGLLWVELAIGCSAITLGGVTTEVAALEAVSSVERGGTKPMTVQTKEEAEEVVAETSAEVDLAGVGVEEVGEAATVMLHLLNSRGTLCSKMVTSPLGDEMGVVEEEEEVNTREVVEVAGIKVMEVNMMGLEEVMEEVGMVFPA